MNAPGMAFAAVAVALIGYLLDETHHWTDTVAGWLKTHPRSYSALLLFLGVVWPIIAFCIIGLLNNGYILFSNDAPLGAYVHAASQ